MLGKHLVAASLAGALTLSLVPGIAAAAPIPASTVATPEVATRASSYALTPLLTGGILDTKREVTLNQSVSVRPAEPNPDGCDSYSDGQVALTEALQVTGLVDLGYPGVPRATDWTPQIPRSDVRVSGSVTTQGQAWACDGDQPILAQGGTCTRSFSSPPDGGSLIEPRPRDGYGDTYEPGVSKRVFGVAYYDSGIDCYMENGQITWVPGLFINDYWWESQDLGAFSVPVAIARQDKGTVSGSLDRSDTSCLSGDEWWNGEHGSAIYVWTGQYYGEEPPEGLVSRCSSVRKGLSRTSIERALVVNEVRLFQMTPAGDYREVPPTEKFVDGNTVRVEMLIENRWKKDITAPIELWDATYKRKLEPEKGQQHPFTETFMAGAQKKVTFLWRTDGTAWEDSKPISGRDIDILTPYGGAKFTANVQPRPALLVHGWNSSAATWDDWPGFVRSTRDGWYVQAVRGMDTDPRSGRSIQENATKLAEAVQTARRTTGAVHVDLVVHSMGGLISRWYITHLMGGPAADTRPVVRSLTMFGTPHLGSDCATGVLANRTLDVVANAGPLGASLSRIATAWAVTGSWTPTIQLTPAYLTGTFRASTKQNPGIHYSHLSGTPIPRFACGVYGNQEGPNDGAVVLPSSIGGGLGGRALAPPLPVMHISVPTPLIPDVVFNGVGMTSSTAFYNIALNDVLGLGPDRAPKLVPRALAPDTRVAPRAETGAVARAVLHSAVTGAVGTRLTLTKPAGDFTLVIDAPADAMIEATAEGSEIVAASGGVPVSTPVGGSATTISITSSGGTGDVRATLVSAQSWFDVTTKRTAKAVTVSVTIPDRKATVLEAVIVSGTSASKVVTLKGKAGRFSASLPLPKGDAPLVIVKGTRGKEARYVTTSG